MWDTEHNNGVLIYLLLADRDVEIVADRGIDGASRPRSGRRSASEMETHFREGRYEDGRARGDPRVERAARAPLPGARPGRGEQPDRPVVL